MAKISVIVPVYKAEPFVAECMESILGQTFSDFEVIAVDDGSPDGSYQICRAYAQKDPRILVLRQENAGQSAARNHALKYAGGEWLCYVDSDDVIHPQMLEFLYQAVMETGAPVSMCQFHEAPALPEGYFSTREPEFRVYAMDDEGLAELYDRDQYPSWVACAKLIRRDLVESYPFAAGRIYEDNEAVCRWLCNGGSLAWIPQDLYFYRTNIGSTTKGQFSLKKLDYLWALESIIRFYGSLGYAGMKRRFGSRYADAAANTCYSLRSLLQREDLVTQVERQAWRFIRQEKLTLTRKEQDALVDAAHPKLMKFYWPVVGALRTLKDEGLRGIMAKLMRRGGSK